MIPGMMGPHPAFPRFPGMPGNVDSRLPTAANFARMQPTEPVNSLKRSSPMSDILNDDSLNIEQKKMRLQSSMRMLKDEPVPEGYMRFR